MKYNSAMSITNCGMFEQHVSDEVYLLQIFLDFQNQGQFWKPHNMLIKNLSLILRIDQDL